MRSLFIFNPSDLGSTPRGGVQLCSQEMLECIEAASESVSHFHVVSEHRISAGLRRRAGLAPYSSYVPEGYRSRLKDTIRRERITHAFINKAELMRFSKTIREIADDVAVILMSHGNQSGDDLGDAVEAARHGLGKMRDALALGLNLIEEGAHRKNWIDGVCVMSEEERTFERWLGCRHVLVLPRVLRQAYVPWEPAHWRLGYSGTLTHPPNRRALTAICDEIQRRGLTQLELRVVGGPATRGTQFARRYDFVTYLGPLSDDEVRIEARTWSAFLNPMFGLARGASMKLAWGLALGLPVVSTKLGARGYDFGDFTFPLCGDSPAQFVDGVMELMETPGALHRAAEASRAAVSSAPSVTVLGARLRQFASGLGRGHENSSHRGC